jgi:gliding motility-associated lipoprotein GldH
MSMKGFLFGLIGLALLLQSCDDKLVFEENRAIPESMWAADEPMLFEFDITDTVRLHDFFINLRNGEEYPYSNLFLFVEMEFPNGKKAVDTLDCPLADASGRWYGSGLGRLFDQRVLYRSRVRFPLVGHYRVDIYQAMREKELKGIHDIGFRVAASY